jgi:hypothetical protein
LCGVALGKGENSFEAIPEILAGSTTGYQSWDAEVPQVPQVTCLVEVLEECERSVAGEEIHQVAGDGGHSVKDASDWGRSCRGGCSGRCLRDPVGGEERRTERGLQLHWIPLCYGRGLRWTSGGGSRWKAREGPAHSYAHFAAAYADRPQSQCCPPR